ncbi:MAG TPA: adenylyl-sulfate kinase, partial [Clostridiales bacterium]|nr:adenylyl-sulfate kinase [Clostridiales bacterium]
MDNQAIRSSLVPTMNVVIVGHVDHGKSTIVGRLLADTGSLPEGKLEQVRELCRRTSKPFEYAFLLDALKDERDQGITIDSARCFFQTPKRKYIIIDAPGHIEFLRNMVTGAARAEAALLVIDASEGIMENSRRHGTLISMLGISKVIVLVNKMDIAGYRQQVFQEIQREYSEFLASVGIRPIQFIPVSGMAGDGIATASDAIPWYDGPTVLVALDALKAEGQAVDQPFRMPVQGVYKFTAYGDDRRIIAGTAETGSLKAGDEVVFSPSGKRSRVKTIESTDHRGKRQKITAGYAAGFTLDTQIYISRGELVSRADESLPHISSRIRASVFWLGQQPLELGRIYIFKLGTSKTAGRIEKFTRIMDASTLAIRDSSSLQANDAADCIIALDR